MIGSLLIEHVIYVFVIDCQYRVCISRFFEIAFYGKHEKTPQKLTR